MSDENNKVKMIMIVYENGDKQFFNNYKYRPEKGSDKSQSKSKGLAEVKKIDKANPETFEELVKIYENVY